MNQQGLFDVKTILPNHPRFDGADYQPKRDDERLRGQLLRIYEAIKGGQWMTLAKIEALTGDPQPSISAQMRHLRKQRFGSHTIEKRYVSHGLYEYRLVK